MRLRKPWPRRAVPEPRVHGARAPSGDALLALSAPLLGEGAYFSGAELALLPSDPRNAILARFGTIKTRADENEYVNEVAAKSQRLIGTHHLMRGARLFSAAKVDLWAGHVDVDR